MDGSAKLLKNAHAGFSNLEKYFQFLEIDCEIKMSKPCKFFENVQTRVHCGSDSNFHFKP